MSDSFLVVLIVIGVLQLILFIATMVFFSRVNKIKKAVLKETDYYRQYWIESKLGNNDKAYYFLIKNYLNDVYTDLYERYDGSKKSVDKAYRNIIKKKCEELKKPIPNFNEIESSK